MDLLQASLSSRAPSAAPPAAPFKPSNDDIEAVIQMATSARPTPDGRSIPPRDTRTQLFVGNLPYRVRWQDLKDLFRRAGTVLRADVSLGPDNRSRGYGTVLLATAEEAGRAVDMFNGFSWQTRILEVRPDRLPPDLDKPTAPTVTGLAALPPSVQGPIPLHLHKRSEDLDYSSLFNLYEASGSSNLSSRSLFVGNLPFHCQWQDLKDLFRQAGTIIRADVALGPDGRSRGFGTVSFATDDDAERAMNMFNGYEYNGRVLKVHFDKFTQLGQTASHPASPSLQSIHLATNPLASLTLNSLPKSSAAYAMAYASQASHPMGYQLSYSPPSRPSSPLERHLPAPVSQRRQQLLSQSSNSLQPLSTDILAVANSLSGLRLTGETANSSVDSLKENILSENPSTSTSRSGSRAPSSSSSHENTAAAIKNPPQPGNQLQHPHHPGPIALPPPPPAPFSFALHRISLQGESAQTPNFINAQFSSQQQITPLGLPPMTPSMPSFTFLPPQLSPHQYPSDTLGQGSDPFIAAHIPSLSPLEHPSSPAYRTQYSGGFSPAMSPGAFFGRPGNPNPHINPAVGAPVHSSRPRSPGHIVEPMSSPNKESWVGEPTGYFDPEYFPRDTSQSPYVSSSLANEILKDDSEMRLRDHESDPATLRDVTVMKSENSNKEYVHGCAKSKVSATLALNGDRPPRDSVMG